jgi:histidinol-phosphate aminotransferase
MVTLRLHLNENTAGCSPAVLDALRSITAEEVGCYPDYPSVTAACERWFGVPSGCVQLTNGLDEGLHVVAQAAARLGGLKTAPPPDRPQAVGRAGFSRPTQALIVEPAFDMYELCAEAAGLGVTRIAPEPDFRFPIDAILDALAAPTPAIGLVFLTDPNNPTGLPIPKGDVERILAAAPEALVLLDEAYAEFSGRTMIGAIDRHQNLVVGRTFSKAHGLAGLRVGALVAHPDTLAPIRRMLPPFSLNGCAVRALDAALRDRSHLEWFVAQSVESRRLVSEFCARHGLVAWPSQANFVLVRLGDDAQAIVQALARRGILVRDRSHAPGCAGCVRIAAGVAAHTRVFLSALEEILASRDR